MFKSMRLWFMLLVLVGGFAVAACGGDDDKDDDNGNDQPTATAPADGGDTTPADGGNAPDGSGNGDGVFGDIPIPDGANETDHGTFSGSQIPFIDPSGSVDASTFGDIEYKIYETSDSAESVINFYSDELSDWDEAYKFAGSSGDGSGGFGIWTKDDGRTALWVGASESNGTTEATVIVGTAN